jgi:hypothetical protein
VTVSAGIDIPAGVPALRELLTALRESFTKAHHP